MLRQLLTVLAVIAGLTSMVEPAQALTSGVEAVRLADAASPSQAQVAPAARTIVTNRQRETHVGTTHQPALHYVAPTVILQADRARE